MSGCLFVSPNFGVGKPMFDAWLSPIAGHSVGEISVSHWALAALLLSCVAFVLVCWMVLRLDRGATERIAAIPLSDQVEDACDEC